MDVPADREKLIRDHWDRYGHQLDFDKYPRQKVPILHPVSATPLDVALDEMVPMPDVLEFCLEYGSYDGRPAYRVVCEGVELTRGFR